MIAVPGGDASGFRGPPGGWPKRRAPVMLPAAGRADRGLGDALELHREAAAAEDGGHGPDLLPGEVAAQLTCLAYAALDPGDLADLVVEDDGQVASHVGPAEPGNLRRSLPIELEGKSRAVILVGGLGSVAEESSTD